MGKISNYASALKAKLTDYFVIASNNNGVLETKKVTTEQIGDAVASDQVHSSLNTSDKSLIGGINEVNSNVGALSSLTTTDKSSIVGAVNEVDKELNEKITRESVAICGLTGNGFRRLDINLNTTGTRTVTINTVTTPGDATDHKSKFSIDNRSNLGTIGLYTTDTSIQTGRPYFVNFTLS